jgi:hypothetical protein
LRDDEGYWRSAAGSMVPIGGARGWSSTINIRHTAKCLDLLLLQERFRGSDAEVFQYVLRSQAADGSFPQVAGGHSDLWATAYVMNLLLRAQSDVAVRFTTPLREDPEHWHTELRTKLSRARDWMCSRLGSHGLWEIPGFDPQWTSRAVVAEIGGDLSINRPDVSSSVGNRLSERALTDLDPVSLWGLLLVLSSLREDLQANVVGAVGSINRKPDFEADTLTASCLLRLLRLSSDPSLLTYYKQRSLGHESCLPSWAPWAEDKYKKWCVRRASEARYQAGAISKNPKSKADAWAAVLSIIDAFRREVERGRGWELLWDGDKHREERAAQVAFFTTARPLCAQLGILLSREPETGRGPVDFSFANGLRARIHVEFKLTDSSRLMHGLENQLPEYAVAEDVDSAIYVCVGFDDAGPKRFSTVQDRVREMQASRI